MNCALYLRIEVGSPTRFRYCLRMLGLSWYQICGGFAGFVQEVVRARCEMDEIDVLVRVYRIRMI